MLAPAIKDNDGHAAFGKMAAKVIGSIFPKLELIE